MIHGAETWEIKRGTSQTCWYAASNMAGGMGLYGLYRRVGERTLGEFLGCVVKRVDDSWMTMPRNADVAIVLPTLGKAMDYVEENISDRTSSSAT